MSTSTSELRQDQPIGASDELDHFICPLCYPAGDGPRFCGTPNDDPGWAEGEPSFLCVVCDDVASTIGCPECGRA